MRMAPLPAPRGRGNVGTTKNEPFYSVAAKPTGWLLGGRYFPLL